MSLLEIWLSNEKSVEVLCITEHHRVQEDLERIIIAGFKLACSFCRKNRTSKGGCCIYVKVGNRYTDLKKLKDYSIPYIFEICGIDLYGYYVISLYRPKTEKDDNFHQHLENVLTYVFKYKERKIIICGDFNINTLVESVEAREFIGVLQSYNVKLYIKEPTRITSHSQTCIDNMISNIDLGDTRVIELGLSDHTLQYASLNLPQKRALQNTSYK